VSPKSYPMTVERGITVIPRSLWNRTWGRAGKPTNLDSL